MRKPGQRVLSDIFRYRPVGSFFLLQCWRTTFRSCNDRIKQFTEIGAPLVAFYWVSICVRWDFVLC